MRNYDSGYTCADCMEKCNVFKALTKEELDDVYEHRYDTTFRSGEVIAKQGSPISNVVSLGMYIILSSPFWALKFKYSIVSSPFKVLIFLKEIVL